MKVHIDMEERGRRVGGVADWNHLLPILALDENEWLTSSPGLFTPVPTECISPRAGLGQCLSTFVRLRPSKFFFHKTRARSQQIYS